MPSLRTRLLFTSLLVGCLVSCVLDAAMWKMKMGPWFPPFWPGWFFAIATKVVTHGEHWNNWVNIALVTVGNAVFYAFISLWVIKADVAARGRIGRQFLR